MAWVASALGSVHLLGLAIGPGAVLVRAWALRRVADGVERDAWVRRALMADNLWGVAAVLWIGTGLLRAFGGWEKGSAYYLAAPAFHLKMTLLGLVLALEAWPMVTLIRWRVAGMRGGDPDVSRALTFARISEVELAITLLMVVVAGWMARGLP